MSDEDAAATAGFKALNEEQRQIVLNILQNNASLRLAQGSHRFPPKLFEATHPPNFPLFEEGSPLSGEPVAMSNCSLPNWHAA